MADDGKRRWLRFWRKAPPSGGPDEGPVPGPHRRERRAGSDATFESAPRRRPRFNPSIHEVAGAPPTPGPRLPVSSWVYQLQKIKAEDIHKCDADVVVVDCSPDGDPARPFTQDEVRLMQTRPGGGRRIVLSYMSIGEANQCFFYWNRAWLDGNGRKSSRAPGWLHEPNDGGWKQAWKVRFWDKAWQQIIATGDNSMLNKIITQGFDGVYLDIIDGYTYWLEDERRNERRPSAGEDMIAFVSQIARHARVSRQKPGFFIVPQNGEGLLADPGYRAVISAIGKEDVLFDMVGQADAEPHVSARRETGGPDEVSIASIIADLARGQGAAPPIPVLAVEYLRDWAIDAALRAPTIRRLQGLGFVPHLAKRDLDDLSEVVPFLGTSASL